MAQPKKTHADRFERWFRWSFVAVLVVIYMTWHLTNGKATPARLSAVGGVIAFIGVVVMAIPVLRVGVFQYILKVTFEGVFDIQGAPPIKPPAGDGELERERRSLDAISLNVFGPMLVGIGTLINGFSGLFDK